MLESKIVGPAAKLLRAKPRLASLAQVADYPGRLYFRIRDGGRMNPKQIVLELGETDAASVRDEILRQAIHTAISPVRQALDALREAAKALEAVEIVRTPGTETYVPSKVVVDAYRAIARLEGKE